METAKTAKEIYQDTNALLFDDFVKTGDEGKFITLFTEVNEGLIKKIINKIPIYSYTSVEKEDVRSVIISVILEYARECRDTGNEFSYWSNVAEWRTRDRIHDQYDETGYSARQTERIKKRQGTGVIDKRISDRLTQPESFDDPTVLEHQTFAGHVTDVDDDLKSDDIRSLLHAVIDKSLGNGKVKAMDITIVTESALNGTTNRELARRFNINEHTVAARYKRTILALQDACNKIDPQAKELLF